MVAQPNFPSAPKVRAFGQGGYFVCGGRRVQILLNVGSLDGPPHNDLTLSFSDRKRLPKGTLYD